MQHGGYRYCDLIHLGGVLDVGAQKRPAWRTLGRGLLFAVYVGPASAQNGGMQARLGSLNADTRGGSPCRHCFSSLAVHMGTVPAHELHRFWWQLAVANSSDFCWGLMYNMCGWAGGGRWSTALLRVKGAGYEVYPPGTEGVA